MPETNPQRRLLHYFSSLGLTLLALLMLFESYQLALSHRTQSLMDEAQISGHLRVIALQSELDKQAAIPLILAEDSDIINAIQQPEHQALNSISIKLEKLHLQTRSAAIYLLDKKGIALAASNWALPTSFVGSNYSFREYFKQALAKGAAEQFALGTVSRKPGLYLARRIGTQEQPLGVVVLKVEFDAMESAWAAAQGKTFVTGSTGEILLSSQAEWRFKALPAPGPDEIHTQFPAPIQAGHLHLFTSIESARNTANSALAMTAMAEVLLLMCGAWWRRKRRQQSEKHKAEERYRQQLEHEVAKRTQELSETNRRLSEEIAERQQAKAKLNELQADLVQANKLAALGQITAGVAHEINQPLATIRVLTDNILHWQQKPSNPPLPDLVQENLQNIVRMSERIGRITGDLRAFSRKATRETEPVALGETLQSSILLNSSRLRENKVTLDCATIPPELHVTAGRIRLEQVLVNLLQNAFEAVANEATPKVSIRLSEDGDWIRLSISDNGPGIEASVFGRLFTPFVTTKLTGLGLGLVIAHDIIRDFGGELKAETSASGASFHLTLRKVTHHHEQ